MLKWNDPVAFVGGATPVVRRAWESLGIETVGGLLSTLPRRYDDYSKIVLMKDAQAGEVVTVRGKIVQCGKLPTFRRRMQIIKAVLKDETGSVSASFFNQPWLVNEFTVGREILFSGKVTIHPRFGKSMANPLWEPAGSETVAAGKLAPVYGLSGTLTQKRYRQLLQETLEKVEDIPEGLAPTVLQRYHLPTFREALRLVHLPASLEETEQGRRRFAFDEILGYRLALSVARLEAEHAGAPPVVFDEAFAKRFVAELPFQLTDDQKRASWAALKDMEREKPMRRLLQGDVGSGKTAVAAFLAAHVQRAGFSAALLVPTDILAKQHAKTLQRMLSPHRIPLMILTRTDRRYVFRDEEETLTPSEAEKRVAKGNIVIVGTHALLEPKRLPPDLTLAVVDEQHRFGVEQRETLVAEARPDGRVPHLLSMTATPIPRSLALTLYGDLDVSILHEKPAGRLKIVTKICRGEGRETAYAAIREAAARKERAYIVCPLIDPSDVLGAKSVTDEFKRLNTGPLQGLRIGLLHGKLKPVEKEDTMQAFANGELDVLLATSVIEVGVDVPEATVIAIEGAERFGLAQLHQLRGRVGRSTLQSRCFLLTDAEGESLERLSLLEKWDDGFALAEEDLKRRGSGMLAGTVQSGHEAFQAARWTDLELMAQAKEESERMLSEDPKLEAFGYWKEKVKELQTTRHLE